MSQTWHRLKEWRREHDHKAPVSFEWFALSLDLLYAIDALSFDGELLYLRRRDDADRNSQ